MPELETATAPTATDGGTAPVDSTPAPAENPGSDSNPSTEADQSPAVSSTPSSDDTPQATDPAVVPDATPGETTPEHGVNPDKGIDPDAGDESKPVETPSDSADDPSKMTDQQRAAYYHQLRNSAKQSTEKALDERYQPQSIDTLKEKFMEEGYDEFQAQMLADRENDKQARELAEIRAEVSDLNATMGIEALEVVSAIPWLNPAQKEAYGDGKLASLASQLYENFVVRDHRTAEIDPRTNQPIPGTGVIIEAKLTPAQFYGALDRIRASGVTNTAITAQRNAERQMASVAPPTSTTSSRSPDFESMTAAQKKAHLESKGHTFN